MIVKFFLPIFYDFFRKSLQNKGFRYENFSDFGTFRYGFMENLRFGWKKIVPNATIGYRVCVAFKKAGFWQGKLERRLKC
jgi:hypothetical protein